MRRRAGEHRIEQRAQGVDVPADVGNRLGIGLLGSHEKQRAQGGRLLVRQARLAKIGQPRLRVLIQQHVGRLQIAVQHPLAVRVQQADGHVAKQTDRLIDLQPPLAPQQILERAVLEVFHHVVGRLGIPADVEQLHHVTIGRQKDQLFDLARQAATNRSHPDGRRT